MALKKFRPLTPGQRHRTNVTNGDITTSTPEKSLLAPISKSGGRNNTGKMTMRYIGGGHKRMYRVVDFKRDKHDIPALVKQLNTILTVQRELRYLFILMVRNVTS